MIDQKDKARAAVARAIARGTLVRPEICSECGQRPPRARDGRSNVHAHHHAGYARPLDVEWLCVRCHFKHDLRPAGSKNGNAKLTEEDVQAVKASSETHTALARRYGVARTTISRLRRGTNWVRDKTLAAPVARDEAARMRQSWAKRRMVCGVQGCRGGNATPALNQAAIDDIRSLIVAGWRCEDVGEVYGISRATVSRISRREGCWSDARLAEIKEG